MVYYQLKLFLLNLQLSSITHGKLLFITVNNVFHTFSQLKTEAQL